MPKCVAIFGHPGHELLVHNWMERCAPQVWLLTDGSGSRGVPRVDASLRTVKAARATPGPLFGMASDRSFYTAIMQHDYDFFEQIASQLAAALAALRPAIVLSDSIEWFNPIHDLASVIATLASRHAGLPDSARFEFPIEQWVDYSAIPAHWRSWRLTPQALERKLRAASLNDALAPEVVRLSARSPEIGAFECLIPVDPERLLLPTCSGSPHYEVVARERIASGVYTSMITLQHHVAPLVEHLARAFPPLPRALAS